MKKKFLLFILVCGLGATMTACGEKASNDAKQEATSITITQENQKSKEQAEDLKTEEDQKTDPGTEVKSKDNTTSENPSKKASGQTPDGYYVSCMAGDEKGVISMEMVGDELHIKGTVIYDASDAETASERYNNEYYFADKTEVREYVFLLSPDTQYIASGGDADSTYDRQIFEESYCTQPDLGLGLYITVDNGVVTRIETAS